MKYSTYYYYCYYYRIVGENPETFKAVDGLLLKIAGEISD